MLVLSHKEGERAFIDLSQVDLLALSQLPPEQRQIVLTVTSIAGNRCSLGYEAPRCIPIKRESLLKKLQQMPLANQS
jgi:sRNA-binding carbon storage regulator CsrA